MAGGRRKVSFVLQFTETGDPAADPVQWRGALREVESGQNRTIGSYEALLTGLADHGIDLKSETPGGPPCPHCQNTFPMPWERT